MDLLSLCLPFHLGVGGILHCFPHHKRARFKSTLVLHEVRSPIVSKSRSLPLCATRGSNLELCKLLCTLLWEGDSDFLFLVVIKVACVSGAFALGNKGSFHLEQTDGNNSLWCSWNEFPKTKCIKKKISWVYLEIKAKISRSKTLFDDSVESFIFWKPAHKF